MTRIVGTKIQTGMSCRRISNRNWRVTLHRWAWQLHATKGWRIAGHSDKDMIVSKHPTAAEITENTTVEYHHGPQKPELVSYIDTMLPADRERMLMRHGWYRRKLRKEAEAAV